MNNILLYATKIQEVLLFKQILKERFVLSHLHDTYSYNYIGLLRAGENQIKTSLRIGLSLY